MSGRAKALYFWVLQRHTLNSQPELRKIAGEYTARIFPCIMDCHALLVPLAVDAVRQFYVLVCDLRIAFRDMLVHAMRWVSRLACSALH